LGGIGDSHCDAIAALDNVEVVAVADLLEEKRRESM
jgi:predicted dehydrogenase